MKIKLILFSLLVSVNIIAQEINIGIHGGILTNLSRGTDYGPGEQVSLGYSYFFHEQWAVVGGVSLEFYQTTIKEDRISGSYATIDNEGESFIFNYRVDKYKENTTVGLLTVPVRIQYLSTGENKFYASLGAKFARPTTQEYSISASQIKSTGSYP